MSEYAPGGSKYGKVCEHDTLERQCDLCHYTNEVARLTRELEQARRERDDLAVAVDLLTDELWKRLRMLDAIGLPKTDANPIALSALRKAREEHP